MAASLLIISIVIFLTSGPLIRESQRNTPTYDPSFNLETEAVPTYGLTIYNPYQNVDFANSEQYKINVLGCAVATTEEGQRMREIFPSTYSDQIFVISNISRDESILIGDQVSILANRDVVGVEISGFEEDGDLQRWDELLSRLMPESNVFAMSANIIVFSTRNNVEYKRNAVIQGNYMFLQEDREGARDIPTINSVSVNNNSIIIDADNFVRIEWFTEDGRLAGFGNEINPNDEKSQWREDDPDSPISRPNRYLRAVIVGVEGSIFTQAFGLI